MASVVSIPYPTSTPSMDHEHALCGGCHNSVDDSGGVVVAFGNSLWHVDCFKCAKCGDRVSADTNLLLLSDGSPVCTACSYNCAVCKKPISHEAIMTGDESYHSACFTCKTCGRHIGELVFAKTTQGIYCMACHNERVARSRRHQEQRKNRSKTHRDGVRDKDKDRLREKTSNSHLRDNGTTTPDTPPTTPGLSNPHIDSVVSHAAKRVSTQSVTATLYNPRSHGGSPARQRLPTLKSSSISARPLSPLPSPTIQTTHASPPPSSSGHNSHDQHDGGDTLTLPKSPVSPGPRRKSFDDGVQPLKNFLTPEAVSALSRPPSSAGETSRADKRSSINPAVQKDWATARLDSQVLLSPVNTSPTARHSPDSGKRSPSPQLRSSQRGSPRSPATDTFYSPPTSPSFLTTSQPRSHTEFMISQERDFPAARKHSLPDTTWPPLHHRPSTQSHGSSSGRTSPTRPLTPNGNLGTFLQQQQQPTVTEHLRPYSSMRDLPSLPSDAADDDGGELELAEDPQTDDRESIPIALPPMSFLDSEDSFEEVFKLGSEHPSTPAQAAETPGESDTNETTKSDAQPLDEDMDAGTSRVVTTAANNTTTVSSPPKSPLTTPPRRNQSLSKKLSARKPVPMTIIPPEAPGANAKLVLDDPSNGPPSPRGASDRPDEPSKASDSVEKPNKRPGSAGMVSSGPPPLSPRSKARRSSTTRVPEPISVVTPTQSTSNPVVTVTDSGSSRTARPTVDHQETSGLVAKRIKEALSDAHENGATSVRLDREFLEVIYMAVQAGQDKLQDMRGKVDGMRRASQQYIDGLSVAQDEYDNEVAARREAEAEVTRLKAQVSGQAARLTELSAEERKRDVVEQMSRDMSASLRGLERDLSKLKAERDLTVAEVEELAIAKTSVSSGRAEGSLQRSLTQRFDNLKVQYKRELEPLVQQREALQREIGELKEERNICLEETTALNARNEVLAELNAQTSRQLESRAHGGAMRPWSPMTSSVGSHSHPHAPSTPRNPPLPSVPSSSGYLTSSTSSTLNEERDEPKATPNSRGKWFKPSKETIKAAHDGQSLPEKETLRHNFQQLTILRFARCDHCGDKMWGTQLRCNTCNIGCHNRCVSHITLPCASEPRLRDDVVGIVPLQPSMFGRDLIEQVRADSFKEHRDIPILVEKCISAVEHLAMDYEGIYRKTGGSSQSRTITHLFERGNYDAFDLRNSELFNDISSITSVLKSYFRQLPNPLLTHALHEAFVGAASSQDPQAKADSLSSLVYQLPSEHFHTLRFLMLHLYRVQLRCAENLMNARNLGVVFGPTLMRSSDPNREFADMGGKAFAIEWLIEHAPTVFREDS